MPTGHVFNVGNVVEDCKAAVATDKSHKSVANVVARAMADPDAALAEVGSPTKGGREDKIFWRRIKDPRRPDRSGGC